MTTISADAPVQTPSLQLADRVHAGVGRVAEAGPYAALSVIFLAFGALKFTAYEAGAIEGLVANSFFMAPLLDIVGQRGTSNLIGSIEVLTGFLIAGRFVSPKLSAAGAALAIATFVTTLSFIFSTPGVSVEGANPLLLSVLPGQFLLKDLGLLALSFVVLHRSLNAAR